jgi:AcrR family transcriptional regulator
MTAPDHAASAAEGRAERKRQRILEAAGRCFARDGFAKATVEEIARQAGVSKGLVYVHFASKDELLEAVLEETLREWREVTWKDVEAQADGALETIAVMHRSSVRFARSHPVLRTILARDARLLLHPGDRRTRESMAEWRRGLIEILEAGVESGEIRPDVDVERTADVIRLLHLSFLDRLYTPGPIDTGDESLISTSIDILLNGLARDRRRSRRSAP